MSVTLIPLLRAESPALLSAALPKSSRTGEFARLLAQDAPAPRQAGSVPAGRAELAGAGGKVPGHGVATAGSAASGAVTLGQNSRDEDQRTVDPGTGAATFTDESGDGTVAAPLPQGEGAVGAQAALAQPLASGDDTAREGVPTDLGAASGGEWLSVSLPQPLVAIDKADTVLADPSGLQGPAVPVLAGTGLRPAALFPTTPDLEHAGPSGPGMLPGPDVAAAISNRLPLDSARPAHGGIALVVPGQSGLADPSGGMATPGTPGPFIRAEHAVFVMAGAAATRQMTTVPGLVSGVGAAVGLSGALTTLALSGAEGLIAPPLVAGPGPAQSGAPAAPRAELPLRAFGAAPAEPPLASAAELAAGPAARPLVAEPGPAQSGAPAAPRAEWPLRAFGAAPAEPPLASAAELAAGRRAGVTGLPAIGGETMPPMTGSIVGRSTLLLNARGQANAPAPALGSDSLRGNKPATELATVPGQSREPVDQRVHAPSLGTPVSNALSLSGSGRIQGGPRDPGWQPLSARPPVAVLTVPGQAAVPTANRAEALSPTAKLALAPVAAAIAMHDTLPPSPGLARPAGQIVPASPHARAVASPTSATVPGTASPGPARPAGPMTGSNPVAASLVSAGPVANLQVASPDPGQIQRSGAPAALAAPQRIDDGRATANFDSSGASRLAALARSTPSATGGMTPASASGAGRDAARPTLNPIAWPAAPMTALSPSGPPADQGGVLPYQPGNAQDRFGRLNGAPIPQDPLPQQRLPAPGAGFSYQAAAAAGLQADRTTDPARAAPASAGPSPATAVQSAAAAPVQPTAAAPVQPTAANSVQPMPTAPVQPMPSTPGQPTAAAPVQPMPSASGQPTAAAPVQPTSATPVQPLPTAPVQPMPSTPVQTVAAAPVQPLSTAPVQLAAAAPRQSARTAVDPAAPLQPTGPILAAPAAIDMAGIMGLVAPAESQITASHGTHAAAHRAEATLAQGVAQQLARAATLARGAPEQGTELRLDPQELGKVRLTLHMADNAILLQVQAERPETTELIRRHINELVQEFRNLGYAEVNVSLGQSGGQTADGGPGGTLPGASDQPVPDPDAAPVPGLAPPRPVGLTGSGGLDLRL